MLEEKYRCEFEILKEMVFCVICGKVLGGDYR